jgi:hypothetical protein
VAESSEPVVITGALSYTGKYVTPLLLSQGCQIRTLTNHPERENPFGESVQIFPYNFNDPGQLRRTLRGASTLINTYWLRFPRGASTMSASQTHRPNPRSATTGAKRNLSRR